jgi:hypothetical protein
MTALQLTLSARTPMAILAWCGSWCEMEGTRGSWCKLRDSGDNKGAGRYLCTRQRTAF